VRPDSSKALELGDLVYVQSSAVIDDKADVVIAAEVWFHGVQSTSTGGSSVRNGRQSAICCWLLHHMRWVLMTPLRQAGRTGGEEKFDDGVAGDARVASSSVRPASVDVVR